MYRFARLHWFAYAMVLAASCAVVLLIVPGQVAVADGCFGEAWNKFEHGWPWIYLERWALFNGLGENALTADAVPWRHSSCWRVCDRSDQVGPTTFRPWLLAADVACGAAMIVVTGAMAQWWSRTRQRIWQLTVKDLLACVLLASTALAWWRWQYEFQAEATRVTSKLQAAGAQCEFGYAGPAWIARLVGSRSLGVFDLPVAVALSGDSDCLAEMRRRRDVFSHLKHVELQNGRVSAEAIDNIARLANLRRLSFFAAQLDDRALDRLAALTGLRELTLVSCGGMTDAAIARLQASRPAERVTLLMTPCGS